MHDPAAAVRLDAHQHVWDLTVRPQPWTDDVPALRRSFAMDDVRPSLRAHDIDATIVVQTVCVDDETPELLALADADPDVAGVVGWVDLTLTDVADRLAELRERPGGQHLVGVRHQVQSEPDARWLCRPDVRRGLAAVEAAGLVYDLVVVPAQLPAVVDTVRARDGLRFVLDHAGKPPIAAGARAAWRDRLDELAASPNVAVKLSGLVTEAGPAWDARTVLPWADAVLDAFGPDRTMFGSDWPTCTAVATYDRVVALAEAATEGLTVHERADVFGGAAARWYGIGS